MGSDSQSVSKSVSKSFVCFVSVSVPAPWLENQARFFSSPMHRVVTMKEGRHYAQTRSAAPTTESQGHNSVKVISHNFDITPVLGQARAAQRARQSGTHLCTLNVCAKHKGLVCKWCRAGQ